MDADYTIDQVRHIMALYEYQGIGVAAEHLASLFAIQREHERQALAAGLRNAAFFANQDGASAERVKTFEDAAFIVTRLKGK